jgi:polyisoprenoid-binding protein YceI
MNANTSTAQAQTPLADTRWRLDPSASTAEFRVPHFWGLVTVKGHFERLDGYLEVDHCGQRQMTLTIDAASLHTGISQRDKHLRAAAFFDTQNHPEVRFRSTSVSDIADNGIRVDGELEAAGERLAMTLEPTIHQTSDQLEIDVTTTVDQRQLGMTWSPLAMTKSPVTLTVHASLRRQSQTKKAP